MLGSNGMSRLFEVSRGRIQWLKSCKQPTQFALEYHSLKEVFDTPALIQELALFSETRQARVVPRATEQSEVLTEQSDTASLFLRILAAADFYTLDKSLMKEPPLVEVDISQSSSLSNSTMH